MPHRKPANPVIPNVGRDAQLVRKELERETKHPENKYNLSEWHRPDLKKDPDVYHSYVVKKG